MARRRFQDPTPKRRGAWWTLRYWQDEFKNGKRVRVCKRVRLAPAAVSDREARRLAAEHLRPLNQGLQTIGSATNFRAYVEKTYVPIVMPTFAKSTQGRTQGVTLQWDKDEEIIAVHKTIGRKIRWSGHAWVECSV